MAKRRNQRKRPDKEGFFSPENEQNEHTRGHYSKPPDSIIIEVLFETKGILLGASKKLGCSRTQLYQWIEQYPELKQACNEAREQRKDFYESKLDELAEGVWIEKPGTDPDEPRAYKNPPSIKAIELFLTTRAKDRGYIKDNKAPKEAPEVDLFDSLHAVIQEAREKFIELKENLPTEQGTD